MCKLSDECNQLDGNRTGRNFLRKLATLGKVIIETINVITL